MTKMDMIRAIASHRGSPINEDYLKKVARKKSKEQIQQCYDYANKTQDRNFAYACMTSGVYE